MATPPSRRDDALGRIRIECFPLTFAFTDRKQKARSSAKAVHSTAQSLRVFHSMFAVGLIAEMNSWFFLARRCFSHFRT